MKFRGKMIELGSIQHFTKIVNTVAKLAKVSALRITKDKLYLIMTDQVTNNSTNVWCEMKQGNFFNEFTMEGLSAEFNEIFLQLPMDMLVTALKSTYNAKSLKLKLTKKLSPCLTLEIELQSLVTTSKIVVHDIPVEVIPRRLWGEFEEPEMLQFNVSIYMPALKTLRTIIERMKNLDSYVTLQASQDGEMTLKVETDTAMVSTHFNDLENPSEVNGHEVSQRDMTWAEARIDIKKLNQFLSGQQVNPTRVICNIVHHKMVHLFLLHDDLSLQYQLPNISK